MLQEEHCRKLEDVAYKSCIYSYFNSKDRDDVAKYWIYLFKKKRFCEAKGVEKALELIDIYLDIDAKKEKKNST